MLDRTIQPRISSLHVMKMQEPVVSHLPNGLTLKVLRAGENDVVRIDVVIKGGKYNQSQPLQSLFTNRMLREGTRKYTAAEIAEKLDYYGAWLDLSASSEYDFITLYSLNRYLPQTLEVFLSMLQEPVFPDKELQVIKENNLRLFQVNSSKVDFLASRALLNTLFGNQHPCGRLACEDDYRNITSDILKDFYHRFYRPENATVFLSGKVTDECLERIQNLLGAVNNNEFQPLQTSCPEAVIHQSPDKRRWIERKDVMQSAVRLGLPSIPYHHDENIALRVLVTLFGGYFGSRLMSNIREEKGYTYGISANLVSYPDSAFIAIATETANQYVEPLIQEIYREVDRLQQELVPDAELSMVRNYMLGEMCRSQDSVFTLADAWIFLDTYHLQPTYFDDYLEVLNSITSQQLRDLAQRYLSQKDFKEVIAGMHV